MRPELETAKEMLVGVFGARPSDEEGCSGSTGRR